MKKQPIFVYEKMKVIGIIIFLTGCLRMYKDGDSFGLIMRAWHPISWLIFLLAIVPCAFAGEKVTEIAPFKLNKFWKENIDQLQWVHPLTRLDSLKGFRFKVPQVPDLP